MIAYLSGNVIAKKDNFAIIETQGVGYEVYFSQKTVGELPAAGERAAVFCCLEASERGVKLYGFLSFDGLEVFKIIRNIQGVGPRAASEIASTCAIQEIERQIKDNKADFLRDVPGIGPKKAAKIILELSGQLEAAKLAGQKSKAEPAQTDEALLALMNLGFAKQQAKEALAQLPLDVQDAQKKIALALKVLGRKPN
ncbi:MAG: Holliday junction branch migration protein RuvA [Patescibacteria group bacterium]|nr:Holliday junction branch migration protein RuvA [Patescibacteria group bacterium]